MRKLKDFLIIFAILGIFFGIFFYNGVIDSGLLFFLFFFVLCLIFIIGVPIKKRLAYKKISHLDFEKEKVYFREIIQKYSISELSFIDGFKLDNPKDIISVLLKFERNKIIEIKDDKIVVLDYDDSKLKYSEKYLLSHIDDGYLKLKDDLDYIYAVQDDCESDKLIEKIPVDERYSGFMSEMKSMGLFYKITIILLEIGSGGLFLLPFISAILGWVALLVILSLVLGILMAIIMIIVCLFKAFKHSGSIQVDHKLLDDGRVIHSKLEGLKYYLKDFDKLDKEESQSVMIWDDYLMYSVMFGFNKKIIDKYRSLIKVDHYVTEEEKAHIEFDNSDIKDIM